MRDFQTGPDVRIAVAGPVPVELDLAIVGGPVTVRNITIGKRFSAFFLPYHQISFLRDSVFIPQNSAALYKRRHAISIFYGKLLFIKYESI